MTPLHYIKVLYPYFGIGFAILSIFFGNVLSLGERNATPSKKYLSSTPIKTLFEQGPGNDLTPKKDTAKNYSVTHESGKDNNVKLVATTGSITTLIYAPGVVVIDSYQS